jgi:hypothetical protein
MSRDGKLRRSLLLQERKTPDMKKTAQGSYDYIVEMMYAVTTEIKALRYRHDVDEDVSSMLSKLEDDADEIITMMKALRPTLVKKPSVSSSKKGFLNWIIP